MNLLYYGDNLDVLRTHIKDESIDLVYLDPLFKSNQDYNVLFAEGDGTAAASQIKAEKTHEAQHRCDFWNGNVFTKPCEFLESRGFAAEIPILQQRLSDLRQQKTLTPAERHEMQQLMDELSLAQGMADPKGL